MEVSGVESCSCERGDGKRIGQGAGQEIAFWSLNTNEKIKKRGGDCRSEDGVERKGEQLSCTWSLELMPKGLCGVEPLPVS